MFTKECKLLWIDLETTGLDPTSHVILEVAAVATDWNFEYPQPLYDGVVRAPQSDLDAMNDYVRVMHTESGLLDDVYDNEHIGIFEVERELLAIVEKHYTTHGLTPLLAGSSVHFDKAFLKEWMPDLYAKLHYRIFDVSTLKAYREATTGKAFTSSDAHRAMADVLASIDAAKDFRRRFPSGYVGGGR